METLIFVVLFVAVPATLLTMGFIAVITREKEQVDEGKDLDERPPTNA